ncbi:transcription termination factor MTERF15, mitochondrial-like [Curcuma longa]|uniref:transcription termination factor MTERF15, mitochondrial-like n=1 Tax=Curcuma longa TaxID=136217 RepID=UPI003D9E0ED0
MKRLHCFFCKTVSSARSPRPHDAALLFAVLPYSASATAAGAASTAGKHMFMAQYLVDSCGFDQEKATEVSKLLNGIESRQQPDSVLAFLKRYGFDDASVKRLLHYFPKCLLLDVEKTLAPKFRAFEDLGLCPSDIVHLVRSNPCIVKIKHERTVPKIEFWQGLFRSKDALVKSFKRNRGILAYSIEKKIQPNIELLREYGLDGPKLASILRSRPLIVAQKADFLKSLIRRAEDLGVPRTSGMFHRTLLALSMVNPEKFKMQMELFRSFGWSEDDFVAAFQKCPTFPLKSSMTLQRTMEFLINEVGYASSYIAIRPILLIMSLERRLIPRHRILATLKSRGHCETDCKVYTYMKVSEAKFVEKYIILYKDRYPDLSELYASLNHSNVSDSRLQRGKSFFSPARHRS